MSVRDRTIRYPSVCPDCGKTRWIGYAAAWAISAGHNSGTCDPCARKKLIRPHIERVLQKLGPADANGCWPWLGHVDKRGYGRTHDEHGCSALAHREVYVILVGPIPSGLELDHLCRNPPCANPSHMEPVTGAENKRRAAAANYTNCCPSGHPFDEANTYVDRQGYRKCRACRRHKARAYYQAQKVS